MGTPGLVELSLPGFERSAQQVKPESRTALEYSNVPDRVRLREPSIGR